MATAVPSGREVLLRKGSLLDVTQMLGGSVTVRDGAGIYRVEGEALDALGPEIADEARAGAPEVEGSEEFSEQQVWMRCVAATTRRSRSTSSTWASSTTSPTVSWRAGATTSTCA
jgi:hypothetical protein